MRVLDSLVEMVELVHKLAGQVARQDRDLAQQMKRAITGAALNASEGVWARTGKRRSRLEDAVNSARETLLIPDSLSGGARRVANNSIFS